MSNQNHVEALKRIVALDPEGVRGDDLGLAVRIARAALSAPQEASKPEALELSEDEAAMLRILRQSNVLTGPEKEILTKVLSASKEAGKVEQRELPQLPKAAYSLDLHDGFPTVAYSVQQMYDFARSYGAEHFETLDVRNHVLERGMRRLMERLATLLDEDQFADCEHIVKHAGVETCLQGEMPHASKEASKVEPVAELYVTCHECTNCGHIGINDSSDDTSACNTCDWEGPYQQEDKCPGCERQGTMTSACPKCGSRYHLLAEERIAHPTPQALSDEEIDAITLKKWGEQMPGAMALAHREYAKAILDAAGGKQA